MILQITFSENVFNLVKVALEQEMNLIIIVKSVFQDTNLIRKLAQVRIAMKYAKIFIILIGQVVLILFQMDIIATIPFLKLLLNVILNVQNVIKKVMNPINAYLVIMGMDIIHYIMRLINIKHAIIIILNLKDYTWI